MEQRKKSECIDIEEVEHEGGGSGDGGGCMEKEKSEQKQRDKRGWSDEEKERWPL